MCRCRHRHQGIEPCAPQQNVVAFTAIERVIARSTFERVIGRVAGHDIIAGSTDRILDQGAHVAIILQRVVNVAERVGPTEIGALEIAGRIQVCVLTRVQVDVETGRVIAPLS